MQWTSAETAPRDGTPILAVCDGEYNGGAEICAIYFNKHRKNWVACGTEESLQWCAPIFWAPQPSPPNGIELRRRY